MEAIRYIKDYLAENKKATYHNNQVMEGDNTQLYTL